jgi:hypothetical protein
VTAEEDARELERELLTGSLGEAGAAGGRLGGRAGGGRPGAFGGESGGRTGARWAAKRLREDRCELALDAPVGADEAMRAASAVLSEAGEPVDVPLPALEPPEVWAIVGTGLGRMNPAVTRVAVEAVDAGRSRVTVRAVAKEGLIKQHGGRKAAQLVRDRLAEAFA